MGLIRPDCGPLVFLTSNLPAFNDEKSIRGGGFLLEPKIGTFVIVQATKKKENQL